jgi:hypothetical protein
VRKLCVLGGIYYIYWGTVAYEGYTDWI